MYKATSTWANCSAHITTNRNRSKVYEGNCVYLKDKQTFEIELFNPTQSRVLSKISLNGRQISNSGIVIRPGERAYLERFIDDNSKFLFETYSVEDSEESKDAISQNGLIEISFYPEISSSYINVGTTYTYGGPFNINETGTNPYTINCNNTIGGNFSTSNYSGDVTFGGTTVNNVFSYLNDSFNKSKDIETGRIEKGGKSKQNFQTTSGEFSWLCSNSISYKILPESLKPVEVSQIRNYCTGCGTRVKKSSWKFCPSCGEKI